jgi:membrane-associated protease RseP (regulator of RpoE activity)
MTFTFGVVLFVVAVVVIVMVHESGHFVLAKLFGMKVEEFFVGFGPRLWSFRRGETEYGVKAIPAGGYVRIAGMNPFQEEAQQDLPRTFGAKPVWQRFLVIFAGPVTHFLIAFVLLTVYFTAIGAPSEARPVVAAVQGQLNGTTSPAAVAGLRPGDAIVELDGRPVGSIDNFITYARARVGQPIRITVSRDGRDLTLTATPVLAPLDGKEVGRLGLSIGEGRARTGPATSATQAADWVGGRTVDTVRALGQVFGPTGLKRIGLLLTGSRPRQSTDVASIVGGTRIAGEAAQSGNWDVFIFLLAALNIFVGLINLLPLPPLDGGHIAALVYEKVRRRKPDLRKLVPVSTAVALFIILFSLSLIYIDITNPIPNPFH